MELIRYSSFETEEFDKLYMLYANSEKIKYRYNFDELCLKLKEENFYFLGISKERVLIGLLIYKKVETTYYIENLQFFKEDYLQLVNFIKEFIFAKDNLVFNVKNDYLIKALEEAGFKNEDYQNFKYLDESYKTYLYNIEFSKEEYLNYLKEQKII